MSLRGAGRARETPVVSGRPDRRVGIRTDEASSAICAPDKLVGAPAPAGGSTARGPGVASPGGARARPAYPAASRGGRTDKLIGADDLVLARAAAL